jgi:hypothetical protein
LPAASYGVAQNICARPIFLTETDPMSAMV